MTAAVHSLVVPILPPQKLHAGCWWCVFGFGLQGFAFQDLKRVRFMFGGFRNLHLDCCPHLVTVGWYLRYSCIYIYNVYIHRALSITLL